MDCDKPKPFKKLPQIPPFELPSIKLFVVEIDVPKCFRENFN